MTAYHSLVERFRRLNALGDALGHLYWDRSVMMPAGGAASRAETIATVSSLHHEMLCEGHVGDWIEQAEADQASLSAWDKANLREIKRLYRHATALPRDLVEALSRASSDCEQAWLEARAASDFSLVLPKFEPLVALSRQAAQAKADALGLSPYDALLDEYEPGGSSAEIDQIFADLEGFLPNFLNQVLDAQGAEPPKAQGPFPIDVQEKICRQLIERIGFDFNHGRVDVTTHPFCGGVPSDVRIAIRYREDDFFESMLGVIHETGHGLYERGLPADWQTQPVGKARGMSIHESQSLMMEMQTCRSREFFTYAAPILAESYGGQGEGWTPEALYRRAIRVSRGMIRVSADEVTYPLHVILRYRLEKAMMEGTLAPKDLPDAWNSLFESLLGVPVVNDAQGCMQDIHWYDGAFGYFPTYTLGAMTAAQLRAAANQAVPNLNQSIAEGNFAPLLGWLKENIHAKGSFLSTAELLTQATGKPLDADAFKAHLKARYLPQG